MSFHCILFQTMFPCFSSALLAEPCDVSLIHNLTASNSVKYLVLKGPKKFGILTLARHFYSFKFLTNHFIKKDEPFFFFLNANELLLTFFLNPHSLFSPAFLLFFPCT